MMNNKMSIKFSSHSENEQFARTAVASFIMYLDPTVEILTDVKTAVSEAVTNCIVHGYPDKKGTVLLDCEIINNVLHIKVSDNGVGIEDINSVLAPFYTSKPIEERSGMGFTIMKTFMDSFEIISDINVGTTVIMTKVVKVA